MYFRFHKTQQQLIKHKTIDFRTRKISIFGNIADWVL